jgi:hypothetical protein
MTVKRESSTRRKKCLLHNSCNICRLSSFHQEWYALHKKSGKQFVIVTKNSTLFLVLKRKKGKLFTSGQGLLFKKNWDPAIVFIVYSMTFSTLTWIKMPGTEVAMVLTPVSESVAM